jgi:hypothetical protein
LFPRQSCPSLPIAFLRRVAASDQDRDQGSPKNPYPNNFDLNVVALRALKCPPVMAGFFGLNTSEIHPCAASRTVWMIDGFRAFRLNGFARHGLRLKLQAGAQPVSQPPTPVGRASVGDGYSVCLLCRLNKPASAGRSMMLAFTQESQSEARHRRRCCLSVVETDKHPPASSGHDHHVADRLPEMQSRNAITWHRG